MTYINHLFFFCFKFPITAIREIKILNKLDHPNVIHLKEIVTSPGNKQPNLKLSLIFDSYVFFFVCFTEGRDRDDQGKPG